MDPVDSLAFKRIRKTYSLDEALGDISIFGALYNLGVNFANKWRLEKMAPTGELALAVKNTLKSENRSIIGRVAYLASIAAIAVGDGFGFNRTLIAGAVSTATLALTFMIRAGFNSRVEVEVLDWKEKII